MDSAFFIASKLIWGLISPDNWIVIGIGIALLAIWRGRRRMGLWVGSVTLSFLLLIGILPLGDLLLRPLETRFPAAPAIDNLTGIIVLGGGEDADLSGRWDQVVLKEGAERLVAAFALSVAHPDARIVFSGGSAALGDLAGMQTAEADVAARFFAEMGLDFDRLILERSSRNTAENARMLVQLIDPQPGEVWVLVTSAFHMPRAMRSFAAVGWAGGEGPDGPDVIIAYPVDYRSRDFARGIGWDLSRNLGILNLAVREYVGLSAYRLAGR